MNSKTGILSALGALALGAGLMYVFDPDRGARRRVRLQKRMKYAGKYVGKRAAALALETRRAARQPLALFH